MSNLNGVSGRQPVPLSKLTEFDQLPPAKVTKATNPDPRTREGALQILGEYVGRTPTSSQVSEAGAFGIASDAALKLSAVRREMREDKSFFASLNFTNTDIDKIALAIRTLTGS